jgi:Ca2+-binding RTX toxin-like protein
MSRIVAATPTTLITNLQAETSSDFEVVALNSDRYVVVYRRASDTPDQLDSSHHHDLQFQIWGVNGTQITGPTRVTEVEGGEQGEVSVAEGPNGVFAVAWRAAHLNAGNTYVFETTTTDTLRLSVFNPDGTLRTAEAIFEPGGTLPNWAGVAAGWTELAAEALPVAAGSAFGTILNPSSTDMMLYVPGFPIQLAYGSERAGTQNTFQIVDRPGAAMTLAWLDQSSGVRSLRGGILDVPGGEGTFGSEWFIPLTSGASGSVTAVSQDRDFEVTVLALGQTVVSYFNAYHQNFRVFNADGTGGDTALLFAPEVGEEALATVDGRQPVSAVAALPDGGFVAVWMQSGYTNGDGLERPSGFWVRSYDAAGNATGSGTLIRPFSGAANVLDLDIDVSDDGRIVVGWSMFDGNTQERFTETRVLQQAVEVLGTPEADTLLATHRAEDFIGLAGSDTVSYLGATEGVSASLAPGLQQTGDAAEDRYFSIENLSGSIFGDDLRGDDLANILDGAGGNDTVYGGDGNDTIRGGDGDDTLYLGLGNDDAGGGSGNDAIFADAGANIIWGGAGNDTVTGGNGADTIYGGGSGANQLYGNDGNDWIYTGIGSDTVGGGAGNDVIRGDVGNDVLYGGLGDDNIAGGGGNDLIIDGAGNNTIWGGLGTDSIYGGADNDIIYEAGAGANQLIGNGGNDKIYGGDGNELIGGGDGNDELYGGAGADTIYTGAGTNNFVGGGAGNDSIFGGVGSDTIYAGTGDDFIGGGDGSDVIYGSAGNNRVYLGNGNDYFVAGTGKDVVTGGPGADTFIFQSAAAIGLGAARDVITDFTSGVDDIDLRVLGTTFNAAGLLGGGAKSFFYFAAGGLLIGDQNGDGAADWVLELTGAPSVTAGDFLL